MRRFLLLTWAAMAVAAQAGGFPFEAFRATTIKQLLIDESEHTVRDQYSTPGSRLFHPPERIRLVATFTGEHRPLAATSAKFIALYGASRPGNEAWATQFTEEWRFEAEGKTWWLPVENQVAAFFPKELRPGDKVELYAVFTGFQWLEKGYDVMLLVEEFQTINRG
jgi:hypothetical protein